MTAPRIRIVTGGTRGLRRDAEVLHAVLHPHWETQVVLCRARNAHALPHRLGLNLGGWLGRPLPLILCSEILPSAWLGCARTRVLVPNQEWMRPEVVANLPRCDAIFCKTAYATAVFAARGHAARTIGFTGADLWRPEVPKDYNRFVHVAGRSDLKGTAALLRTWQRHPAWPVLRVITSRPEFQTLAPAANIEVHVGHWRDEDLVTEANRSGVHLCLSETEGFGHYISEALSTQAVVVVTDAPPMNELVPAGAGWRVAFASRQPMSWSERFKVDEDALAATLNALLATPLAERQAMGERARRAFLSSRALFESALRREVARLI